MYKYGSVISMVQDGGRKASEWWKYLTFIREWVGVSRDKGFEETLFKEVENDESTYFWYDIWLNGTLLRDKFIRMHKLS